MSNSYPSAPGSPSDSTADTAKQQATQLGSDAVDAGKDVGSVAKEEAGAVAHDAKAEARDLLHEARGELRDQAAHQQQRVAGGLRSVGDELHSMASNSEQGGMATDLVKQAASKANDVATWLDDRDPGSLLEDVKGFARRKPGVFIGLAVVGGVLAGRLTRSMTNNDSGGSQASSGASSPAHGPRTPNVGTPPSTPTPDDAPPPAGDRLTPPVGEATNPAGPAPVPPAPPAPPAEPRRADVPYTAPDSGFVPPVEPRREGDLP